METQSHIINCSTVTDGPHLDMDIIDGEILANNDNVLEICSRVGKFLKLVNELTSERNDVVDE